MCPSSQLTMEPLATGHSVAYSNAAKGCSSASLSQPSLLRYENSASAGARHTTALSQWPHAKPRTISDLIVDQTVNNPGRRGSFLGHDFDNPQYPDWTQPHTDRFSSER